MAAVGTAGGFERSNRLSVSVIARTNEMVDATFTACDMTRRPFNSTLEAVARRALDYKRMCVGRRARYTRPPGQ